MKGRRLGGRCLTRMLSSSTSAVCNIFRTQPLSEADSCGVTLKPSTARLLIVHPHSSCPGYPPHPQCSPTPHQELQGAAQNGKAALENPKQSISYFPNSRCLQSFGLWKSKWPQTAITSERRAYNSWFWFKNLTDLFLLERHCYSIHRLDCRLLRLLSEQCKHLK